eukprot:2835525-Rhodomonas_salina.4
MSFKGGWEHAYLDASAASTPPPLLPPLQTLQHHVQRPSAAVCTCVRAREWAQGVSAGRFAAAAHACAGLACKICARPLLSAHARLLSARAPHPAAHSFTCPAPPILPFPGVNP